MVMMLAIIMRVVVVAVMVFVSVRVDRLVSKHRGSRSIPLALGKWCACCTKDSFNVVVMALLRLADLRLKAQDLLAIFAERAVHQILPRENFMHPVDEGLEH